MASLVSGTSVPVEWETAVVTLARSGPQEAGAVVGAANAEGAGKGISGTNIPPAVDSPSASGSV